MIVGKQMVPWGASVAWRRHQHRRRRSEHTDDEAEQGKVLCKWGNFPEVFGGDQRTKTAYLHCSALSFNWHHIHRDTRLRVDWVEATARVVTW